MPTEIVMYRGDDQTEAFTITRNGVAVDLTGADITFSARTATSFADGTTTAPPIILVEPTNITILPDQATTGKGKITLTIPAASTETLDPGLYLADFEIDLGVSGKWTWPEADDDQSTLIRLRLRGEVTRP